MDKMCPLCGFPQIPGITSCVNCGDVLEEDARPAGPVAPEQVAAWMEESRVAREITGVNWNGFVFFGLTGKRKYPPRAGDAP